MVGEGSGSGAELPTYTIASLHDITFLSADRLCADDSVKTSLREIKQEKEGKKKKNL